jgi:hypothetical protein
MNELGPVIAVVCFAVITVLVVIWRVGRSRSLAQRWAQQNGYRLIACERRFFRRGPFWWRTSEYQDVFRVTVIDKTGRQRSGYIRVGGWFLGLLSDVVAVEWIKDE